MSDLRELQRNFLAYLQMASSEIEPDIAGGSLEERRRRLSIYYNAYRIRLRGSIETDHPVLGRYLGDDLFEQLASAYIEAHPSAQTSLRYFCDQLPGYLARERPFADIPVLSDIAAFERLLMDAFDAEDGRAIGREVLSELPPERWPGLVFQFHRSLRLFTSTWNTVEIWQAIKTERDPPQAQQGELCTWLVWRNRERLTEFRSLPSGELEILNSAFGGASFSSLCELLLKDCAESEVATKALHYLQLWIDQGLLLDFRE